MTNTEYLIDFLRKKTKFLDESLNDENKIRSMMNVVMPDKFPDDFYYRQNVYLQELLKTRKITDVNRLKYTDNIALVQGDITCMKADVVVNAGNPQMLGCFIPLHACVDNSIHSYAGLQVRRDIKALLKGKTVPVGDVIVTAGYNLPARYIFHTVGPIYQGLEIEERELASCYARCLLKAKEMKLKSIVFPSISTGAYGYPIESASRIAINTVRDFVKDNEMDIKVVFVLYNDVDFKTYKKHFKK